MIETILTALIISILIQAVFFAFASAFKTDKVTDLSYGLSFILIIFYLLLTVNTIGVVQSIISLMVIIWGLRLIVYLFKRILITGKDKRFDGIRENFKRFLQFWTFQAIAVWIISLPSIVIISKNIRLEYSLFLYIGSFIWTLGILIESFADQQKFEFKNNPKNKDKWIETGIWKYSRHPNYFGEMLCWWGIYTITLPYLRGFEHIVIIGPLFISFLLLFVSGIPTLEKKYDEKYKDDPAYQDYKNRTSLLLPLPKKSL